MKYLKDILIKIGSGALYGIGFCLVMVVYGWVAMYFIKSSSEETVYGDSPVTSSEEIIFEGNKSGECQRFKTCEEDSGLSLSVKTEKIDKEEFTLIGTITNNGKTKWTSVSIQAEIFDNEKNFIDECGEYVNKKVFPGAAVNFKLSCSKCSTLNLDNYDSYKVSISDASTY